MKFIMSAIIHLVAIASLGASAQAKPCPENKGCFEWELRSYGNCAPSDYINKSPIGSNSGSKVLVNSAPPVSTFLSAYDSAFAQYRSMQLEPAELFVEEQNWIRLTFVSSCPGGTYGGGAVDLYYYPKNSNQRIALCQNSFTVGGAQIINCGNLKISLPQVDPQLHQDIENAKQTLMNIDSQILQTEISNGMLENIIRDLQGKIAYLKDGLSRIESMDFEAIDLSLIDQYFQGVEEVRDLFQDLKKGVEALREEIHQEIVRHTAEINDLYSKIEIRGDRLQSIRAGAQVEWQDILKTTDQKITKLREARTSSSAKNYPSSQVIPDEDPEHRKYSIIVQDLQAKLREKMEKGERAEFIHLVHEWGKYQSSFLIAVQSEQITAKEQSAFHRAQEQTNNFIRSLIDNYGFFKDSKVLAGDRRIVQEVIGKYNEDKAEELTGVLSTWKEDLTANQQSVLNELRRFAETYQNFQNSSVAVVPEHPNTPEAIRSAEVHTLVESALEAGIDSLLEAAKDVKEADQLFQSELEEAQQTITFAQSLLDVSLSFMPGVSLGKDVYESLTGKNLVTGHVLSEWERTFAVVGVVTFGAGNYVKGPIKALSKIAAIAGSKTKTVVLAGWRGVFCGAEGVINSPFVDLIKRLRKREVIKTDAAFKFFDQLSAINNPIPSDGVFARVVPREFASKVKSGELQLARMNEYNEAFVTAYEDIRHIQNPKELAMRLSLFTDAGGTRSVDTSNFVVLKFKFKDKIPIVATPTDFANNRQYGFLPGGKTRGGAREWVVSSDLNQQNLIEFLD